jgi:imidazolonepropionase-like amidohydrolase
MVSTPSASVSKPWALPRQKKYLLINVTVVDPLDGSVRSDMDVQLSGGRIASVSSAADRVCSNDSIKIDLRGKFLCPGLIDCHVHIATPPGESGLAATMAVDSTTSLLRQPWLLKQMLHRGFTTIRDCGGATLAMKEAIEEGLYPGPRMFIAGKAISQTGGHGDKRSAKEAEVTPCCGGHAEGIGRIADGVEACLIAGREQLRQGADFIKIMCSGGVASPTDKLTSIQYTSEEILAFTRVAKSAGTYVTAHAYTPESIQHAIECGVSGIEHGNLIDEETAKLMVENGVFLTPTLTTYDAMASREFAGFLPGNNAEKNLLVLDEGVRSIKLADEAGVLMCYGSDLLGSLQSRQTREFVLRQRVLSPLKVLQSATVNGAKRLGMEGNLGRIAEGFLADILILSANPLEDVGIFDQAEKYLGAVIKEGRVMMSRLENLLVEV